MVSAPAVYPLSVVKQDDRHLAVEWSDGVRKAYDVVKLRRSCVCAHCVDEITRAQILRPADVSETVRPLRVQSVGRYAISVEWSDGHRSSIYSWPYLRSLA